MKPKARKRPKSPPAPPPLPAAAPDLLPSAPTPSLLRDRRFQVAIGIVLLVALTVVTYVPAIRSGFIWDDDQYVQENMTLRSWDGLRRMWFELRAIPQYYPMTHTTFWVEYHLWELNPMGYHLVNVLLHASSAVLLWVLLRKLRVPGALAAAALFAAHPVMVESVAWITERKNTLSMVFYLGALLAYLKFDPIHETPVPLAGATRRRWGFYALGLALFSCAMFSKTMACSMPVAILLLTWWKQGMGAWRQEGRVRWDRLWPVGPFFAVGAVLAAITVWMEKTHVGAEGAAWTLAPMEHILLAGRIPWFYLGKIFWPAYIVFFYPRWDVNSHVWWQYVYPAGAVALLAALWLLRKRIGRGPLAAVLYFGVALFPALGFINVYPMLFSYVADHFQYHASVGILVLTAGTVVGLARRWGAEVRTTAYAVLLSAAVGLGIVSWRQEADYKDFETLWTRTMKKNPTAWIAYNNLGASIMMRTNEPRELDRVQGYLRKALELYPTYREALLNMGFLNVRKGARETVSYLKEDLFTEANECFSRVLSKEPNLAGLRNRVGKAFFEAGRPNTAMDYFREALRIDPNCADALNNAGFILDLKGFRSDAIAYYKRAIEVQPNHGDARFNLGLTYIAQNRVEEAIEQFQTAVRYDPHHAKCHWGLAQVYTRKSQTLLSLEHARAAAKADPNLPEPIEWLVSQLACNEDANIRNGREALRHALHLNELSGFNRPGHLDVLAAAYAEVGDFPKAIETAQKAVYLSPQQGHPEWALQIQERLRAYQAGRPWHRAPGR